MATGRGETRNMMENTTSSDRHPRHYKNGHTNGYRNGINGKTNGKSETVREDQPTIMCPTASVTKHLMTSSVPSMRISRTVFVVLIQLLLSLIVFAINCYLLVVQQEKIIIIIKKKERKKNSSEKMGDLA